MLIISPLPEAKPLSHLLLTNGEQQGAEPSDDLMTHIYKVLLQPKHASLQDAGGWQLSIPAEHTCPQDSSTTTVLALVCCKLLSP